MKLMWNWGGKFFGYTHNEHLFTHRGKCVGRIHDEHIYGKAGEYLGEIMSENRLITHKGKINWRGPRAVNYRGGAIARYVAYVGYVMYVGHKDFPSWDTF